jgi:hypothetical protein
MILGKRLPTVECSKKLLQPVVMNLTNPPFPNRKFVALLCITGMICFGLAISALPAITAEAPPTYQWLPVEAADGGAGNASKVTPLSIRKVEITAIPKQTSNIAKFSREYVIDLKKFGISNTGTEPVATTRGLNEALQDAKVKGANRIVFPKGTYLISELEPIKIDHKDTVIDFNGATLQMNTNGLPKYSMVNIASGAQNLRLTNGTLRGDRDTHDYKTIKDPHEGCTLLTFHSGQDLEVDRMVITNAPGFAISSRTNSSQNRNELLGLIKHTIMIRDLESGAFSNTGQKIDDSSKTRSSKPYDISKVGKEFEFGYMAGYQGFPYILDRNYQVVFYDADKKFLEKRNVLQYRKVQVPAGAKFLDLEFNQSSVSTEPAHSGAGKEGWCGRITTFDSPVDVHFHNNVISNNRALGMAFCGGQRWIIENNHWEGNGGQAPSFAVDFEDGWEMMQDVVFRNNTFKGNHNDLVVCAGSELLFEGNKFEKSVIFYGRVFNYTIRDNDFDGSRVSISTRSGVLNVQGNRYRNNPAIGITFDSKGVADGFLRKPGESIATPAIALTGETLENVKQVTGTYFKFVDSKLADVNLIAGKTTVLADISKSNLTNTTLKYEKDGPEVLVSLKNIKGELREEGPGLARKKTLP